jgi:hypothetical protein
MQSDEEVWLLLENLKHTGHYPDALVDARILGLVEEELVLFQTVEE